MHCSSPTMPECLLQVLVTAQKPAIGCFSACIEPIGMRCRCSTTRLACLRMFSCQRGTSWSFLVTLYSEQLVASTKQPHIEWSATTSSVFCESTRVLLCVVNICCCMHCVIFDGCRAHTIKTNPYGLLVTQTMRDVEVS